MKKTLIAIISVVICAAGFGCTSTVQPMDENPAVSGTAPVPSETTAPAATEVPTESPTEVPTEPLEMPIDYELPSSAEIKAEAVLQKPELPTGCEVTALCTLLNYLGFSIDKEILFDDFMPHTSNADCTFDDKYIGDPRADNGFGCNAPVVAETAENYLKSVNSDMRAMNLTGTPFRELFYQIEQGRPVVIWGSVNMRDVTFKLRWTTQDGREAWFATLEHCLVLTGYDINNGIVYVCDPLKGNTEYSLERAESVYDQMGQQAVIIYGDNEINSEPDNVNAEIREMAAMERERQAAVNEEINDD